MAAAKLSSALQLCSGALAAQDEAVVDFLAIAMLDLTADDEESPVTLVEATLGCACSRAEASAIMRAAEAAKENCSANVASRALPQPERGPAAAQAQGARSCARASMPSCVFPSNSARAAPARDPVDGAPTPTAPLHEPPSVAIVAFLADTFPHILRDVVEFVLTSRCQGDQEEAVECLLQIDADELADISSILSRERARAQERESEERRVEREKKRQLTARYEEVPVALGSAPPRIPYENTRGKGGALGIRFRDGEVANVTKGQKFVVEDKQPEWDGGSRGTVKTKGKRGKGTV
ncbi:hypothetical protein T492DRAFT_1018820 [Pavlovales sp. CCMP2436]|nr:hypothetical protein T492DRAFT_1018820 [Pavlovales sp. CCMP2436]|mmetsp:Transcript_454/g.1279  ORF Transcript_454/g.1279 Transcript_454/m.1279 type:complete len:295 (-) Transcript_454:13-897(-)